MPTPPALFDFGVWAICAALILTWIACSVVFGATTLVALRWLKSPSVRVVAIRAAIVLPMIVSTVGVVARGRHAPPQSIARVLNWKQGRIDVALNQRNVDGRVVSVQTVTDKVGIRGAQFVVIVFGGFCMAGVLIFLWRIQCSVRALRSRRPADDSGVDETLRLQLGQLAHSDVRFSTSSFVQTPIAINRSEICLPTDFNLIPIDEERAVLLHEIAHLKRRDPQWCLAVDAMFAASCANPIMHWLRRAHRKELEFAADFQAMQWGARPEALLEALRRFAERIEMRGMQHVGVSFGQTRSPLMERAAAISNWNDSGNAIPRFQMMMLVLLLALVSICAAGALPVLSMTTPMPSQVIRNNGNDLEAVDVKMVDQSGRPILPPK